MSAVPTNTAPRRKQRRVAPASARYAEYAIEALIHLCGLSAIAFIVAIFVFIGREGLGFLLTHAVEMLTSTDWSPTQEPPVFGIVALLAGTFWCVGLSLVFSVPIGLGAAVFLSEFAPPRLREGLKVIVELLAAIPSVVWGFIGVMIVNPGLQAMGARIGLNGLNGAILLALMTLPLLVSLGEDATGAR